MANRPVDNEGAGYQLTLGVVGLLVAAFLVAYLVTYLHNGAPDTTIGHGLVTLLGLLGGVVGARNLGGFVAKVRKENGK